jgi:hypothetical protein
VIQLALLLLVTPAQAQDLRVEPYLQLMTSQSVVVRWETEDGDESRIAWGTDEGQLGFEVVGMWWESAGSTSLHEATIDGLEPATRYWYQVHSGAETSGPHDFVTPAAASAEANVRVLAMSDMQIDSGNPTVFEAIVQDGVIPFVTAELGPDLPSELSMALVPGDLVENGWSYDQFAEDFFEPAAPLLSRVPVYPVPGNHEADSPYFFDYFSLPDNGQDEHWWWHDTGNIRVIGLDSNAGYTGQEQLDWLDGVLADACTDDDLDFVFAQLHHPFKSELWLPGENLWSGSVVGRMEAFTTDCGKPSIHFFGHTHGYSRGQSRDHQHLWVNVATAGGNIDYWGEYAQNDYDEFVVSQDEWGFVLIEATAGDAPEFRLRRVSHGNEDVARNNEVRDDLTVRRFNDPPFTPSALSPANDDDVDPEEFLLVGSMFADPDGDAHQGSHWQVAAGCEEFDDPLVDLWQQDRNEYGGEDLASGDELIDGLAGGLNGDTAYCWRVRYRDSGLQWSAWSEPVWFRTSVSRWTENLLRNPGAEDGTDRWEGGPIEALLDGECDGIAPRSGQRYFAVGGMCEDVADVGMATQSVSLALWTGQVDDGEGSARLRGWLRNWGGSDIPSMGMRFLDADGVELGELAPVEVNATSWTEVDEIAAVPSGSRSIEVRLIGTHDAGDDNDSYFDDLELRLVFEVEDTGDDDIDTDDDDSADEDCDDGQAANACDCPSGSALCLVLLPFGVLRRRSGKPIRG